MLCGCQIAATVDPTPEIGADGGEVPFGTIAGAAADGGNAPDGGATGFGDRRGPLNPWTDSLSAEPSRTTALTQIGQLAGSSGDGPDLVLGGTGIYTSSTAGATIAVDLATQKLSWTGAVRLGPGQMTTDGAIVCGVVQSNNALACLDAATGAKKWQVATNLPVSTATRTQLELDLRGGRLTVYAGNAASAAAFDATTGAQLWTKASAPPGRALVFVGADLVLGSVAVDPATGATRATTTHQSVGYLWQKDGKAYFQSDYRASALSYDPVAHVWADATATLATFFAGWQGNQHFQYPNAYALTETADDGTFYGYLSQFSTSGGNVLCKWNASTQATAFCVPVTALSSFRAHPNRVYANSTVFDAASGATAPGETFNLFFGHFAFSGSNIFGVN